MMDTIVIVFFKIRVFKNGHCTAADIQLDIEISICILFCDYRNNVP